MKYGVFNFFQEKVLQLKNCFLFDFYYPIWYTKNDKYIFFKKEEKMFYLIKGKIFMNGNEIIFLILTLAIGILGGYLADKNQTKSIFSLVKLFPKKIKNSIFHYKNDYLWSFLF